MQLWWTGLPSVLLWNEKAVHRRRPNHEQKINFETKEETFLWFICYMNMPSAKYRQHCSFHSVIMRNFIISNFGLSHWISLSSQVHILDLSQWGPVIRKGPPIGFESHDIILFVYAIILFFADVYRGYKARLEVLYSWHHGNRCGLECQQDHYGSDRRL